MNCRYFSTLYLVWTALFLDWLLYTALLPVIPSYLKKLHVSQPAIGVLFASKVHFDLEEGLSVKLPHYGCINHCTFALAVAGTSVNGLW